MSTAIGCNKMICQTAWRNYQTWAWIIGNPQRFLQSNVCNFWDRFFGYTGFFSQSKLSSVVPAANIESLTGWPRTRGLHASRRPRYRTRSSLLAWHRWAPVWCRMVWICFTLPKTNIFTPENRPSIFMYYVFFREGQGHEHLPSLPKGSR